MSMGNYPCNAGLDELGILRMGLLVEKEEIMAKNQRTAEDWLAHHKTEIFSCPYQPDNLRISQSSCALRHQVGRKAVIPTHMKGDGLYYSYLKGLLLCRDCPIGIHLTSLLHLRPARLQERYPSFRREIGEQERLLGLTKEDPRKHRDQFQ